MTDTMTDNVLIGVVADFPDGEIRPASMPDGNTLAGKIVECPWHFGTFDVTHRHAVHGPA